MRTDSGSRYYYLRQQGLSDQEARGQEVRYVWGSKTKRWHQITKEDRDWKSGISKSMKERKEQQEKEGEKLEYAKYILKNNVFPEQERDYWTGKSGKNPMGMDASIWKKAFSLVGINTK